MARIKRTFPVLNMVCASCAAHVGKALEKQKGVRHVSVNLASNTVQIEYESAQTTLGNLKKAVQEIGYDLVITDKSGSPQGIEKVRAGEYARLKRNTISAIIFSLPIGLIGLIKSDIPYANYIEWLLATFVLFGFGKDFFVNAKNQAMHFSANMDTLVALSTGVSYLFSVFNTLFPSFWTIRGIEPHVYFEATAAIIDFILLGRTLEEKAKGNTSDAIHKLMDLRPNTVTLKLDNGETKVVPVENVQKGDILVVKPGEKIAVDGEVTDGISYVDESMLSGEPLPIKKIIGEKVFTGTINQKGSFQFRAEKVGSETVLAQIIRMVQDAQGSKAPVQKLVDRIAEIFVPGIIIISLIAFSCWMAFRGSNAFPQALLAMVTVLLIACPCALGLATPTAIMVGIGKGARHGILIKDAESLELARKINAIVLDKTGTITEGKPQVTDIYWLDNDDSFKAELMSLEKQSEHPLAEAVVNRFLSEETKPVENFRSITGKGVTARIDGKFYLAGNSRLLDANKISVDVRLAVMAANLSREAKTVIWFANNKRTLAVLAIADSIKPTSKETVNRLRNTGIEVWMLTGDNEETAKAIAKETGISNYKAEVLPAEKEKFIRGLQKQGKIVAMVGDGINDSAALARADVSIAMGKGSDIAMDVAKMTIISSDLTRIPDAIRISRQTVRTIRQNLFWAFIYNLIAVPIAAGILYPINGFLLNPMIAGAAMALSSISVVTNSLLLNRKK